MVLKIYPWVQVLDITFNTLSFELSAKIYLINLNVFSITIEILATKDLDYGFCCMKFEVFRGGVHTALVERCRVLKLSKQNNEKRKA